MTPVTPVIAMKETPIKASAHTPASEPHTPAPLAHAHGLQAKPNPEQRLRISVIAGEIGVSVTDMADATGISRAAISDLITRNVWPKRQDADALRQALTELMRSKGCPEDELPELFTPHTRRVRLAGAPGPLATNYDRRRATPAAPATPTDEEPIDMLIAKQSLTPAARRAFGLFQNPFDGEVTSEEEMFVSDEIRYVREACWQVANSGSFVAVMGESGAGKTTLMLDLEDRVLAEKLDVVLIKPSVVAMEGNDTHGRVLKAGDILAAIILTFDPNARVPASVEARKRAALKGLENAARLGKRSVLVIEESHSLSEHTLRHLKRLQEETRMGRRNLLGILLMGHPELRHTIERVREVFQRVEQITLMPLDKDLRGYLEHRAKLAGKQLADLITDDGVDAIRARLTVQRPGGFGKAAHVSLLYPLAVNNLVTAALNVAAELGAPVVNKDVVRAV